MRNTHTRAVLWDMDGTLLDSAAYHRQAWQVVMAQEGRPITDEEFAASFGQRNDTILRGYLGEHVEPETIARISEAKEQYYRQLVRTQGVALLEGVASWLERLKANAWKQAIASAAPRRNIETILEVLALGSFFDAIVSAEDVERGKPDPQVFLLAARRVQVPPERCVVVEDAPAGIEAARRAGMRTIGVCTTHADLQADIVVASLADLPPDAFDRLFRSPHAPAQELTTEVL